MKIPYFAAVKLPLSASTGGRHFHIISLDTAGLWRRVWEAGISKTIVNQSSAIVFSDRAYQNSIELFIPIVHALRNNLAVSRNILRKWQPPVEADYGSDTAKQEFFIRL